MNSNKTTATVRVAVTHNGPFHADDALAGAILRLVYGDELEIVRSRDHEIIDSADIAFDVGGVYDPRKQRFDHHQRGRAKARPDGAEYSSAGLVWEHFAPLLGLSTDEIAHVDMSLMRHVDAIDNGQRLVSAGERMFEGAEVSFSAAIARLNPSWDLENQDFDSAYMRAVDFAQAVLEGTIADARARTKATNMVTEALATRPMQTVVVLLRFCPWQEPLLTSPYADDVLYVVYPNAQGAWMVQAVPDALGSFNQRKPLPESWAGLRGEELVRVSDVEGAIFCHPGRFICGATTKESAIAMAEKAISA